MENQNSGGKRWTPDTDAGGIVRAIAESRRVSRPADARYDVLIDVSVVLGDYEKFEVEISGLRVERTVAMGYTMYTIHVDDALVFDVVYDDAKGMTFGECLPGDWVTTLARLADMMRPQRRIAARVAA